MKKSTRRSEPQPALAAKKKPAPPSAASGPDFGPSTLIRLFLLHQRLCSGSPVNAKTLIKEVGYSGRTIGRDIALLRDGLGAPVVWDPASNTYYYSRTCDVLPFVRLEPAEAAVLSLSAHAFGGPDGAPLGDSLVSAMGKLTPLIGGAVSFPLEKIRQAVSVPQTTTPAELRRLQQLVDAILQRRELRLTYRKPAAPAPEVRTVHPLHLTPLDRLWVLIAYDPLRSAIRHYVLRRIEHVASTGQTFDPPADFDLAAHLADNLGRYHGGAKAHEVRVALDATAAYYANESPWHKNQTITELPDGRFLLTLRINNLVDIRRLILACGDRAEVLGPPELRAELSAIHHRAAARYATGDGPNPPTA